VAILFLCQGLSLPCGCFRPLSDKHASAQVGLLLMYVYSATLAVVVAAVMRGAAAVRRHQERRFTQRSQQPVHTPAHTDASAGR
jgi:hypothetical protein